MEQTRLYVVIPCYNEEQVLPITSKLFLEELKDLIQKGKISEDSRILFVNDGSKDRTWEIITQLSQQDEHFEGISQSRNRGHQNAVLAGLMEAKDLKPGMELQGTVRNVIDFGVFVDIGVHQDGLVHISKLPRRVKHPSELLSVGDVVTVWVLSVDEGKKRISLTMKKPGEG